MGWHERAREAFDRHFFGLVAKWLLELGAREWRGTARELGDQLAEFAERVEGRKGYVPTLAGLSQKLFGIATDLRLVGWDVTFRRSNGKRLIEFSRA